MATIGTFTAQGDGYTGSIKTLTLNVRNAQLRPNEKADDKAPDFRIFSGSTEFGAAWKKTWWWPRSSRNSRASPRASFSRA